MEANFGLEEDRACVTCSHMHFLTNDYTLRTFRCGVYAFSWSCCFHGLLNYQHTNEPGTFFLRPDIFLSLHPG